MLRGMGFNNNTSIYLASGKIYHAEKYLAPLIKMFPNLYTKESLATTDELAPFMVKIFTGEKNIYFMLPFHETGWLQSSSAYVLF